MRAPLDLNCIHAVRRLRAGTPLDAVQRELGLSQTNLMNIQATYANVSDGLLTRIERVLNDRERLRRLISDLLRA